MTRRLVAAATAVLALAGGCSVPTRGIIPAGQSSGLPLASATQGPVVATTQSVLGRTGPVFGVDPYQATPKRIDEITTSAGCRPAWVEIFASVAGGITAEKLGSVPGVPMLSLEPWVSRIKDPDWTLQATIDGRYDAQYKKVATQVRAYHKVMMVRFAHEMNGWWYPWGLQPPNTPEQFVTAWRHVVSIFRDAGATNVLWVWSPNITRGTNRLPIARFYPGNEWVDFIGLTGYGENEPNPSVTYEVTLPQAYAIPDKQIILTEVGAKPAQLKRQWIGNFGTWLKANPRIVGFIWVERTGPTQGARFDWRFSDTPANLAAFKHSLATAGVSC